MRIYANFPEAAKEIERDLWELGAITQTKSVQDEVGEFETRELIGYQFSVPSRWTGVDPTEEIEKLVVFMGLDLTTFWDYVRRETDERWNGISNPGTSWAIRRGEWEKYLHDGKFAYTYPERIWDPTNQFGHAKHILLNDPNSRQAIIQIYDKHKDSFRSGGKARIPCSLNYQYLSRTSDTERSLHCIYTMRSCDFYKHWAYDMVIACLLNCYLANALGWQAGNLIMQMGSLHAFKDDLSKRTIF